MKKLPFKLGLNPIAEAIVEIRFESNIPKEAVFGVVYNTFKDKYPKIQELPPAQIPLQIRETDPQLRFAPLHRLEGVDGSALQVNPNAISLVVPNYSSWSEFSQMAISIYQDLKAQELFGKLLRVSVRYVNVFENMSIAEKSRFSYCVGNRDVCLDNVQFTARLPFDHGFVVMKLLDTIDFVVQNKPSNGSIIDIDSVMSLDTVGMSFQDGLEKVHSEAKAAFFDVLGDFVDDFTPSYED